MTVCLTIAFSIVWWFCPPIVQFGIFDQFQNCWKFFAMQSKRTNVCIQKKIFHKNISKNNIIITNSNEIDDFKNMLIDENFVKEIDSERSETRHQIGTMKFMTIQMLQRVVHFYRHNFELFFYVFLWICVRRIWKKEFMCSTDDRPKKKILTKWYMGNFDDIAETKRDYMHVDEFENILNEFSTVFNSMKSLCKKIRSIFFPFLKNGALFIEIRSNSFEKLYHFIIKAFENAIKDSKKYKLDWYAKLCFHCKFCAMFFPFCFRIGFLSFILTTCFRSNFLLLFKFSWLAN